jgi:malonyl CoA-acyl carrier protein transacylase
MSKTVFLFPGQGSQSVGMGAENSISFSRSGLTERGHGRRILSGIRLCT